MSYADFKKFTPALRIAALLPVLLFIAMTGRAVFAAQTWRLGEGGQWQAGDEYGQAVAQIKRLVAEGKSEEAQVAIESLKTNFSEISGKDANAFFAAEILFASGKIHTAARAYDEFLDKYPTSRFYDAAMERQLSIGTAYLGGEKITVLGIFQIKGYATGERIMEKIIDRAGDEPIAVRASEAVAKSLERRGEYDLAYGKWSRISSKWPTGQTGKDAIAGMARCKYAAYKGAGYDASCLISARSYYEDFIKRYPQDAEKIGVAEIIKDINEQLAYKHYLTGRYYDRTGSELPARLYYQMVTDNWPTSRAAQMARERQE